VDNTDDAGSNSNSALSDGEIAGVVIGCVLFIGIVAGLAYYFIFSRVYKKDALLKNQMTLGSEDQRASMASFNMEWNK
jgi:hypothetical protein